MKGSLMSLREMVTAGGGEYLGIQEAPGDKYLVLFNNAVTRSTLSISVADITPAAVAVKLNQDNNKFGAKL